MQYSLNPLLCYITQPVCVQYRLYYNLTITANNLTADTIQSNKIQIISLFVCLCLWSATIITTIKKKKVSNSKSKTRHTDYFSEVWFKLVLVLSLDFINRKPYYLLQTTFSCQDQSSQRPVQFSSVVEYTEAYT